MLEAKVHPEVSDSLSRACAFHICTDVLSSPRLQTQQWAVCSELPLAPAAVRAQAHPSTTLNHSPGLWAELGRCHCRVCSGWLVTLVSLEAEPHPGADKVLPTTSAVRRARGNSSRSQAAPFSRCIRTCKCVRMYSTYI